MRRAEANAGAVLRIRNSDRLGSWQSVEEGLG